MSKIYSFFKLKENGTTISKEVVAGLTTFFAMVYIIIVNPTMLSITGMPVGAVFLATIGATVIGTLVMALFANVPYALAPGMGLNAFFTFTVCGAMGFVWQEALAIVFICGLINVVITVTKVRKSIINAIPKSLQHAIGGGIGLFIAYVGFKNAGWLSFTFDPGTYLALGGSWVNNAYDNLGTVIGNSSGVPALVNFNNTAALLALIGIVITVVLLLANVKGSILIGIVVTTLIGIPMGVTPIADLNFGNVLAPFKEFPTTFGAAFGGMKSLFGQGIGKILLSLLAIFAFSLSDTFDTIGTFIGTGLKSGIFSEEDINSIKDSKGFNTKMEKALFADSVATSIGAILGTSNTTTYVESAAGIEAGGKTGLTSFVTAICFLLCIFISPLVLIVPGAATAPALIVVGIMMASSFKHIDWEDFAEAVPAFLAAVLMCLTYNISTGIAFGFIFYVIVKLVKKQGKDLHPILIGSTALFAIYYILMALYETGVFTK